MLRKPRKGVPAEPQAQPPVAQEPLMTADKAAAATFVLAEPRGYYHVQVDAFVDQIVESLRQWEQTVDALKQQLYASNTEVDQLRYDNQGLRAQIEIFRVEGSPIVDNDGNYVTESQIAAASTESAYLASEVSRLREEKAALLEQLAAQQAQQQYAPPTASPAEVAYEQVDDQWSQPQPWDDQAAWAPEPEVFAADEVAVDDWVAADVDSLAGEVFAEYEQQVAPAPPAPPTPMPPTPAPTMKGRGLPPPPAAKAVRRPPRATSPMASPVPALAAPQPVPVVEDVPPAFAMPERAQSGPVFEVPMDAWEMNTVVLEGDEN